MGDLNYRLQAPPSLTVDAIKAYSDTYQLHKLLPLDQLHAQQKAGSAFTQFHERRIDFKPTYKYDPSTNEWDSSEKNRAPAWCDRILYYSQSDLLEAMDYSSYPEMIISDHKPVSCFYNAKVEISTYMYTVCAYKYSIAQNKLIQQYCGSSKIHVHVLHR